MMLRALIIGWIWAGAAWADCAQDRVDLRSPQGQYHYDVRVADTDATRAQGLMFVREMPQSDGMLFVYDRPQHAWFWMRNTLIPLDMIFADGTGRITRIHENAIPLDETPIDGGPNVRFVLEVNAGQVRAQGFAPGDMLRHPAIDAKNAAWPCN